MVSPECSSILHDENEKSMYNEERLIELSMVSLEFGTTCQRCPFNLILTFFLVVNTESHQ